MGCGVNGMGGSMGGRGGLLGPNAVPCVCVMKAFRNVSAKLEPAESVSNSLALTFPAHSEPGQWTLSTAFLADAAGNTMAAALRRLSKDRPDLHAKGLPGGNCRLKDT